MAGVLAPLLLQNSPAIFEGCAPSSLACGRLAHRPLSRWRKIRSSHALRRCATLRGGIALDVVQSQRSR